MASPSIPGLRSICAEPYGLWLDSALWHPELGATSFWAAEPVTVLRSRGGLVEVERVRGATERFAGDPFETLRALLAEHRGSAEGAAAGYLGYGLRRHLERLPDTAADELGLPDCIMAFYKRLEPFDPRPVCPPVMANDGLGGAFAGLQADFDRKSYERSVERALRYIGAGDIYQVNLSQRFRAPCVEDPFDVYLQLRALSPAPFAAFLRYPEFAVLSSSPERFLRYEPARRLIETRPIKGTRPRGVSPREDDLLAQELLSSEKDRAENVMIVDLERNDLGRVAEIGSVRLAGLCQLESYATVHHLTSVVTARLRDECDVVDLLRAAFPGGSITGAPKIRAMEIIDELEPVARGVYTGAIGYIRFDGSMDLNIAIRTMVVKGGAAYFHVGGGIVADSDPGLEYEETLHKGAGMAAALAKRGAP